MHMRLQVHTTYAHSTLNTYNTSFLFVQKMVLSITFQNFIYKYICLKIHQLRPCLQKIRKIYFISQGI